MSAKKTSIPARVREQVTEEARRRCGYCLRTEELTGTPMTLDHIIPEASGGPSSRENLKLNNSEIIVARRLWVSVGWWPPED